MLFSRKKKILATVLALLLLLAMTGCAAQNAADTQVSATPTSDSSAEPSASEPSNSPDTEFGSYTIGTSVHGSGVWIIDMYRMRATSALESIGMETTWTSCNFNSEQMINDVRNLIQSGVDGEMYMNVFGTITPAVSELLEEGQIPWVTYCQPILDEQLDMVRENPYYMGNITPDMSTTPTMVAEAALEAGHKNAIIFTAAVGDVINDQINESIEGVFTAGGGSILEIVHCADTSEATTKADDVAAAYGDKIDMAFAANMDFAYALMNSLENYGYSDIPVYTFSADATSIDLILSGKIVATGITPQDGIFASALLVNALDGHKLVDADGNVPHYTKTCTGIIDQNNADAYLEYYINGSQVTQADYESLLYRYNPEVTYASFIECLDHYNDINYVVARNSGN